MQPDPALYLLGARRALNKVVQRGDIKDSTTLLALERMRETMAQLAVRYEAMPAILPEAIRSQAKVLTDAEAVLQTLGKTATPRIELPADPIEAFEAQSWQLVQVFRELATAPSPSDAFLARRRQIAKAALQVEDKVRQHFVQALQAVKVAEEARPIPPDEVTRAPPTAEDLTHYLRERLPQYPQLKAHSVNQLIAFNSKDIIFFAQEGIADWPSSLVLRRMRAFSVNDETSVAYEYQLLKALHEAGVPGARPLLFDETGGSMNQPFLIMERIAGVQQRSDTLGERASAVAADMGRALAKIHAVDPAISRRPELSLSPRDRVLSRLEMLYRAWRDNQVVPSLVLEEGFAWARENIGVLDDVSVLVHGDFDLRNVLIDGTQVAVLDWERSHVGHPAEDLAYCRRDLEAAGAWQDFKASYEANGGRVISPDMLAYFDVWRCLFHSASGGRAHNGYRLGLHDDFITGTAGHVEFSRLLDTLRGLLLA